MPSTMSFAAAGSGSVVPGSDDLDADRQPDLTDIKDRLVVSRELS